MLYDLSEISLGIFAVAPPRGAWIEMRGGGQRGGNRGSLPRGERGLKFLLRQQNLRPLLSLPRGERGLK